MLRDTWLIFCRETLQRARQSFWLVVGLVQPLLYMALLGPMVTELIASPKRAGWAAFTPALLLQAAMTQSMFVGLSLLVEYREGVLGRLLVTPMKRSALLLGKLGSIALAVALLSAIIVLMCRLMFPLAIPVGGLFLCLLLNVIVAVSLAACSYALALVTKNENSLAPILNTALLPLLLLSGAFLPITEQSAPRWLFNLSRLNPISYILDASRAGLAGDLISHQALNGIAVAFFMMGIALAWGLRTFIKEQP